jgi:cytochrome c biogenesis protein
MPSGPGSRDTWLEAVKLRYGAATAWLQTLGLFQAYRSPWFLALLAALVLNTLICTLQRLPPLWRSLTAPPAIRRSEAFYQGFARRVEWTLESPEQAIAELHDTLERHRFHPQMEHDITVGHAYLYAERGRWSQASTLVSHVAALVLVLTVACRPALGWQQGSVTLLPGEVHAVGHGHQFQVRAGSPAIERRPSVPLGVLGGTSTFTRTVRFNHPLNYRGVAFHLQGYGPAVEIITPEGTISAALGGSQGREVILSGARLVLRVAHQPGDRTLFVEAMAAGGEMLGSGVVAHNQQIEVGGVPITFSLTDYSVWQVSRDPTFAVALAAAVLMLAAIVISLWVPHRRLWLRVDSEGRACMVGAGDWGRQFDIITEEVSAEISATRLPQGEGDA